MTEKASAKKRATSPGEDAVGFTAEERAAMKERAREVKAESRRAGKTSKADGERDLLAKVAEMPDPDRSIATRLHELITTTAPELAPRTWYAMPAYAKDGKVLCFFQGAAKFNTRYASFGFSDTARLDAGNMWPTAFALTTLTEAEEKKIVALLKKALR